MIGVALSIWLGTRAKACELALLLAVDVSGSVDRNEYAIQMQGLAAGLRDPVVSETLVRAKAQVAIMQWTGASRQDLSLPWTGVSTFSGLDALADQVAGLPRAWRNYATAIGEAEVFALRQMKDVSNCTRRVLDISGDGFSNEGIEPSDMRAAFRAENIQVNALAIEGADEDLSGYFFENLITGSGAFVVTANGFEEFPEKMRQKLRRETTKQLSGLGELPAPIDVPPIEAGLRGSRSLNKWNHLSDRFVITIFQLAITNLWQIAAPGR